MAWHRPQASHRSEITSVRACEFLLDHPAQRRQGKLNGIPDAERGDILVIMAVDVSGSGHLLPRDPEMASLQLIRQASRGLRDDLEATRHRVDVKLVAVECLEGVATREALGELDMT